MKVEPVDLDEAAALVINLLISQLVIVVAGCAGSVVLAGVASGDWVGVVLGFGAAAAADRPLDCVDDADGLR